MNNKKIDIDGMFSRLREESKPTPLGNLVEARESGALFALKQSASSSLFSAKVLWMGMGTALAVSAGILYHVYTTPPEARQTVHHEVVQEQQTPHSGHNSLPAANTSTEEAPLSTAAPSAARQAEQEQLLARRDNNSRSAVERRSTLAATHNRGSRIQSSGAASHSNSSDAEHEHATRQQQVHGSNRADGITAAHYLYNPDSKSIDIADAALPSLLQPVEEFPLAQQQAGDRRSVSFTMNSVELMADIVHIQGELQISNDISCALLLGVGNVAGRGDSSYSLLMAGAQAHYYVLGDFNGGVQIGTQFLFSTTDFKAKKSFFHENGRVLSIVPYAGYKLVLESGFTLNLQAGVGAATPVYIPADVVGSGDNTEYKWHISPRIQLNVGWSL